MNASDRLYLAENIPFLLVWGERDPIIPVEHGLAAHKLVPTSRLEVFEDAGHFPHVDDPQRFLDVCSTSSTRPSPRTPIRRAGRTCSSPAGGLEAARRLLGTRLPLLLVDRRGRRPA